MGKYSVFVYAICKNEAQFVSRWMDSMQEADGVVVLDTGSSDDTVRLLRERGAEVFQEEIVPWRFDTARNRSLELVPENADICVCTDLDEVFSKGWREELEQVWEKGISQISYRYTWSFMPDGREGYVFWIEKIHCRHGFEWKHPVHEVLSWKGEGTQGRKVWAERIHLEHHPDPQKSRGQYLPLLELSVQEDPEDDRNTHYLGREYMFYGRWDDCIRTLKKHLALPKAVWRDERAASMRYIARAYRNKGDIQGAWKWGMKAITEAPHLREPYLDLAELLYGQEKWEGVLYLTECALEVKHRTRSYISEAESWGSLPHDLRAIAFFKTGRLKAALEEAYLALEQEPQNERLRKNVEILEERNKV